MNYSYKSSRCRTIQSYQCRWSHVSRASEAQRGDKLGALSLPLMVTQWSSERYANPQSQRREASQAGCWPTVEQLSWVLCVRDLACSRGSKHSCKARGMRTHHVQPIRTVPSKLATASCHRSRRVFTLVLPSHLPPYPWSRSQVRPHGGHVFNRMLFPAECGENFRTWLRDEVSADKHFQQAHMPLAGARIVVKHIQCARHVERHSSPIRLTSCASRLRRLSLPPSCPRRR